MSERMSKWHRRGERQKETTDTYRDGWERIFARPEGIELQSPATIEAPVGTHTAGPAVAEKPGDMSRSLAYIKRRVVARMLVHSYMDKGLDYDSAYDQAMDEVFEMIKKGELL